MKWLREFFRRKTWTYMGSYRFNYTVQTRIAGQYLLDDKISKVGSVHLQVRDDGKRRLTGEYNEINLANQIKEIGAWLAGADITILGKLDNV